MGQQFAESLYGSGGIVESCSELEEELEEDLPKWAMRLQNFLDQSVKPVMTTLTFDCETSTHVISIKNDERSWERYFAFVLNDDRRVFRVSLVTGSLAPRGGASNVCDESKPYSDSAAISVEFSGERGVDALLVVGTEAEVWRYRLSSA
mmetsp:Transcript_29972/g.50993  ORF Transcript_29972/g.50993 Transcript_29972/m.50993 type:complete len:149 (-) Transcript_29972:396-842(-)